MRKLDVGRTTSVVTGTTYGSGVSTSYLAAVDPMCMGYWLVVGSDG